MKKVFYIFFAISIIFSSCKNESEYMGVWTGNVTNDLVTIEVDKDGNYICTLGDSIQILDTFNGNLDDNGHFTKKWSWSPNPRDTSTVQSQLYIDLNGSDSGSGKWTVGTSSYNISLSRNRIK
tara:strand:+ start:182 stop:550 length:369 start_codon:yes stop_codon:yes gene_type:complete